MQGFKCVEVFLFVLLTKMSVPDIKNQFLVTRYKAKYCISLQCKGSTDNVMVMVIYLIKNIKHKYNNKIQLETSVIKST